MGDDSAISRRRRAKRAGASGDYTERRAELVRLAADTFKAKGYSATSINDIARAAGMDRATLYYYASSKIELFQEAVQATTQQNVAIAEAIAANGRPPVERLREFIFSIMISYRDHYPYMQVFLQEDMAKLDREDSSWAEQMRGLSRRFDAALISIIDDGVDSGAFRRIAEARLIAYGLIGLLNSTNRWFRPSKGYGAEQIAESFFSLALEGLQAPA